MEIISRSHRAAAEASKADAQAPKKEKKINLPDVQARVIYYLLPLLPAGAVVLSKLLN